MRKWREIHSLHFLILSTFPHSLFISSISIHFLYQNLPQNLSQNVKYGTFVANVTKTYHTRYEEIILGRIRFEEAPQVVPAWYTVCSMQYELNTHKYKGYRRVSSQIHQFLVDNLNDLSRKSYPFGLRTKCQITSKLFWLSIE